MRPTDLKFRSPKEKSSEFNVIEVNSFGSKCFFTEQKKNRSSLGQRFSQYILDARRTDGIGPGSYNVTKFPERVRPKHGRASSVEIPVDLYKFYDISLLAEYYPNMKL